MNSKIVLYLILILSSINLSIAGEPSVDSMRKLLRIQGGREKAMTELEIAKTYEVIDPQERIDLSVDALKFAESENDQKITSFALKIIGIGYYYQGNYKKSAEYFKMALDIFKKLNDFKNINAMYNNLALIEQSHDNYYGALEYYNLEMANLRLLKDSSAMTKVLSNMATLYISWGMYDEANKDLLESKIISLNINDFRMNYTNNINLAKIALLKGMKFAGTNEDYFNIPESNYPINKDSADYYFNEAYNYAFKALNFDPKLKTKNDDTGILNIITHVMLNRNMLDSAMYYASLADTVAEFTGNPINKVQSKYILGLSYFRKNNLTRAKEYFEASYELSSKLQDISYMCASIDFLRQIAVKNQNMAEVYKYTNDLLFWKDTLFSVNNSRVFAELRGQVEYERQQKDILAKKARILKLEQENSHGSNMRNLLILLSIMLLVIAVAYYSRFQIKSKMHEKLEEAHNELLIANTKLKESEDNLRVANSTKDKFLSIISHDLKNSVGSFKNITELLSQNYHELEDEEKMDFLNIMQASSKNLYTMLENLLSWARSQSGRIRTRFDNFPINDIIVAETNFISLQANAKNIRVEVNSNSNSYVFGDYNMISTVIRNLITNAVKFTPNYGKVTIETSEINDYIQLRVSDTGVGIPFEKQKLLFQIDESFSTRGTSNETGTGLGLVLCKEFVERNNGSITFESVPEHGATFIVTLPKTPLHDVLRKMI